MAAEAVQYGQYVLFGLRFALEEYDHHVASVQFYEANKVMEAFRYCGGPQISLVRIWMVQYSDRRERIRARCETENVLR